MQTARSRRPRGGGPPGRDRSRASRRNSPKAVLERGMRALSQVRWVGSRAMRTMPAVVCHGPRDYRFEELPVPDAGPGEVVVRVGAVGICASDLKCYLGAPLFWGDDRR